MYPDQYLGYAVLTKPLFSSFFFKYIYYGFNANSEAVSGLRTEESSVVFSLFSLFLLGLKEAIPLHGIWLLIDRYWEAVFADTQEQKAV